MNEGMKELLIVKYGEVMLKGNNRPMFVNALIRNINEVFGDSVRYRIRKGQSMLYIEPEEGFDLDQATKQLRRVFGVLLFHRALEVEKDPEKIKASSVDYFAKALNGSRSFKIETRRTDKQFPQRSQEINNLLGAHIADAFPHLQVDVHDPDVTLFVNIRKEAAYIYRDKERGAGGLPVGTGGKATALLSGGIDSPLAAWLIARRGVALNALHFHSYPYTSERSKKKVIGLARQLAQYTGRMNLYVFPFTGIQEAIADHCPDDQLTIIMRRMMMKGAEKIARKTSAQALVTGESIAQVASQTMESLTVTNAAVDMPVFRPLIGMDKEEIIDFTRQIGTYNISIEPYSDCCTIFVPRHPQTKPKLEKIRESESQVDFDGMIDKAMEKVEVIEIKPEEEAMIE
ncbi:MAG: tRNA 4-thiouridine(8) synthase ThiI [Bacteroidales bacterium]|nr:tRNA 4-thiouridine(8) synthase ThiI [Bacteroidales bacterium]